MEKATFEEYLKNEKCPARQILSTIGDKWSILVLILLHAKGKIRFNELARQIEDVSPKMLSQTLRTLEGDGLVERTVYPEVPPRVEYNLTGLSETLMPHILALSDWAMENMEEIQQHRTGKNNKI